MDEELKRYLHGMAANNATAMREMEAGIIAAVNPPHVRLDAMALKLEGGEGEQNSDGDRIQAGH